MVLSYFILPPYIPLLTGLNPCMVGGDLFVVHYLSLLSGTASGTFVKTNSLVLGRKIF